MARLFTRAEAEALLPALTPLLTELKAAKAALDAGEQELSALLLKVRGNGHQVEHDRIATVRRERERSSTRVSELLEEIGRLGAEVKDLSIGLIDFRSERDGRIVYLCWRLGEPGIDYWHDLDAGFAGRRPL